MVSFADLRDARPADLAATADAWSQLAAGVDTLGNRAVDEMTGPIRKSGWAGRAASAAYAVMEQLEDECELAALQVRNLAVVIRAAAAEFSAVHRELLEAIAEATAAGHRVDERGFVYAPRPHPAQLHDADGQDAYRRVQIDATSCEDRIRYLVAKASELDFQFARAVRDFSPHFAGRMVSTEWNDATAGARATLTLLGLSEHDIPRPATDPNQAAGWWRGLSPDQRSMLLAAYPSLIGSLHGLPAVVRDEANKLALRNLIGESDLRTYDNDKRDPRHRRLTELLERLEASEYESEGRHLYLLSIYNQGDGRAVVAVGNPDSAAHTAVLVPGTGTTLDGFDDTIERAERIQGEADNLTRAAGDVSVVAWLGYDAPETDMSVATGTRAEAGALELDRFTDGLQTAHSGPNHVTVIGHSYGSTVVGEAMSHGDGLAVTDVVVVGSPGMRVGSIDELGIDPRHVWAGAADNDPVAGWIAHDSHGADPHLPEFGANRFHVATHQDVGYFEPHGMYWDPDSESLRNQARIVTGMYGTVTLDFGKAPP